MNKSFNFVLVLLAIAALIFSYWIGYQKASNSIKPKVEYLPGDSIRDTITIGKPIIEETPEEPEYIIKFDTIVKDSIVTVIETVDTAKILADWIKKRTYERVLFDNDSIGKLIVGWITQYNKSSQLWYDYTPITRRETIVEQDRRPFRVNFGFGSKNSISGQLQYNICNRYSIGYQYLNNKEGDYHLINLGIDF